MIAGPARTVALGCNALHIVKSENGHQFHVYYQGRKTEHFKNQLRLGGLLLDVSDILGLKIYFVCLQHGAKSAFLI